MQTSAFLSKSNIIVVTGCGGSLLVLESWDAAEDVKPHNFTAVSSFSITDFILGKGRFNPAQSEGLQKIWNLSEKKKKNTDVV